MKFLNIQFFLKEGVEAYGPFTIFELVHLDIKEDSLVSINEVDQWVRAGAINGLLDTIKELSHLYSLERDNEVELEEIVRLMEEQAMQNEREKEDLRKANEHLQSKVKEHKSERHSNASKNNLADEQVEMLNTLLVERISEFQKLLKQKGETRYSRKYPSLSNEVIDKLEAFNLLQDEFIKLLQFLEERTRVWRDSHEKNYSIKRKVLSALEETRNEYYRTNLPLFPNLYETSLTSIPIWDNIRYQPHNSPISVLMIGKKIFSFSLFDEVETFHSIVYDTFLNSNNIVAYYDSSSKGKCFDFINTIISRLLVSSIPSKMYVSFIDPIEMEGTSDQFRRLNELSVTLTSDSEILEFLNRKSKIVKNIINSVLVDGCKSVEEFNQGREIPHEHHILVVKLFPGSLNQQIIAQLNQITRQSTRCGIMLIFLIDKDTLKEAEISKNFLNSFEFIEAKSGLLSFDFNRDPKSISVKEEEYTLTFENLSKDQIRIICQHINTELENKLPEAVLLSDYLLNRSLWWSSSSAKNISIPFGLGDFKEDVNLSITQESGENTAVVVGIPGSGKSVFLHTLILNAVVKFSPDELELYLIDFSGVEFNTYAVNELAHAKIIAPEAEREFGLSVLRQLEEEGVRRMELCRQNQVSNVVDLREKCPTDVFPRMLVIIDEFQKLFENESDRISRESIRIINVIVREFRKFGINLILATQKLSDIPQSYFPRDLVGNRVVFKCSPSDIGMLGLNVVPQLQTGECIYNSELGVSDANLKARVFFVPGSDIEKTLIDLKKFSTTREFRRKNTIVFRSGEIPDFRLPDFVRPHKMPGEVNIYLGEPIEIATEPVGACLKQDSNDNVVIVGGEEEVALRVAVGLSLSVMGAHIDQSAKLYYFNFMRQNDHTKDLGSKLNSYSQSNFDTYFYSKSDETLDALQNVKTEIDLRNDDEKRERTHIYITFLSLHLAQMFKKVGRGDPSEHAKLLDFILKNGSLVGVFVFIQVDNYSNLLSIESYVGDVLRNFTHRVVLQMSENDSNKIMGTSDGNRLYQINRPSSKNRGFYYNNRNNITRKFKPFKF